MFYAVLHNSLRDFYHERLHGQIFAPCKICIDLQGWRKCRKIDWSNRGHHILVGYAGGRQKTAPAFSAFATSLWFSNAGAIAETRRKSQDKNFLFFV
jgi:hypothetical protein